MKTPEQLRELAIQWLDVLADANPDMPIEEILGVMGMMVCATIETYRDSGGDWQILTKMFVETLNHALYGDLQ